MSAQAAPLVEVRDAALAYRGRSALDGVDLDLAAGEALALLGPNGAGKTSLMRLIAGRRAPGRGHVRVAGGDPFVSPGVRRAIGWVPQEIALYPRLTVAENLDVFAQLGGLGRRARRASVAAILERAGIGTVGKRLVGTLSGGYQRRVNIAASLVTDPRVILLDEPTQGVDLDAREAIHALLTGLKQTGAALLLSTHDFAEAERLADRVAILQAGRIVREGRLAALLRGMSGTPPEHDLLLDAPAAPRAAESLRRAGFVPLADGTTWRAERSAAAGLDGATLLETLRSEGVPVAELRLRRPGLEAVYREALSPTREAVPARRALAEAVP